MSLFSNILCDFVLEKSLMQNKKLDFYYLWSLLLTFLINKVFLN